jgi:hypothetical protein
MVGRRRPNRNPTAQDATELAHAIHALGDFAHVTVQAQRGHLLILAGDEEPVARLTPLPNGSFGLSFRNHTGRWEPMPVAGDLAEVAYGLVDTLGMYLAKPAFPLGKSGSDH